MDDQPRHQGASDLVPSSRPCRLARVLLVDDDAEVRRATQRALEQMGCTVTTCSGGEQAIRAVALEDFDAILCDIFMPGLDGVELMRRLRASGVRVPFILMSGVADPLKPVEGIAHGACCFVTKPVPLDVLEATLAKLVKAPVD